MKNEKRAFIPPDRAETVRHNIISVLRGRTLSARDISSEVHIPEKEVYNHMDFIQKSLVRREGRLTIIPAECVKCGFVFKKRERFKKPGKCPVCRGEKIKEPLFTIQ